MRVSTIAFLVVLLVAAVTNASAQRRVSPVVQRQIDSALSILGMHQRDLPMPADLLERDVHRTAVHDNLFRTPFSSVDISEDLADSYLINRGTSVSQLQDQLHSCLAVGAFKRYYLDNMPDAETVLDRLKISRSKIGNLNIASSIVLLRHSALLLQAIDAVAVTSRSQLAEIESKLVQLDSLWRISKSSETASVWEVYAEEQSSQAAVQKLYASVAVASVKKMLDVGPSVHDDLVRISNELLGARDVLIDSITTAIYDTPIGRIAIGGPGNDVYQGRFAMIIDVGGHDVYNLSSETLQQRISAPVRIIVDLEGNDTYRGADYALASGLHGVDVLIDRSGNDSYHAGSFALGSGMLGYGILHDFEGEDAYIGGTNTQGSGILGVGILLDDAGNDSYRCHSQSQAFAGVSGVGFLGDRSGNDTYVASSPYQDVLRYEDHQITFSQGAALGSRPYASGGVAVLADGSGSDTYVCDIYGQGTGYWFGIGSLIDRSGDDRYLAHQYAQGSGVHFATGFLHDNAGNDVYSSHGVSQGCGHDIAYGMLFDEDGDDTYACESLSLGGGNANAVSIFVDVYGNDSYAAADTTNTMGFSDYRRGYGMIGLFIDSHGNDLYSNTWRNTTTSLKSTYGLFTDFTDSLLDVRERAKQAPYMSQVELPNSIDSLMILASASHLRFQHNVEPARKKLASFGIAVLPVIESRLGTLMPRERLTVESVAKHVYAAAPDSVVGMLRRGLQSTDYAATGTAATIVSAVKTTATSSTLLELATGGDWRKRRLAASTLGEVRDTVSIRRIHALLADSASYVRARAAFAIGATDSLPLDALSGALADSFQIVRNSAIEGINRGARREMRQLTQYLNAITSESYFRSNVRLLINADTSKSDVAQWKAWIKSLPPDRLSAVRRLQRQLPTLMQPALVPSKPKAKKAKRVKA
jgi:hypothetical protein